ncbi:MAG: hypothetical protein R6V07_03480 [Armatimonadota bacterium]
MSHRLPTCAALVLITLTAGCSPAFAQDGAARDEILENALPGAERTWTAVERLDRELSSRGIYEAALIYCEAGVHHDRLQRMFEVAARMQDRDPDSRGYGNFRWRWREGAVMDFNAVDFCMQAAAPLWIRHADDLPADARAVLAETIDFAIEGLLRHRVPPSYTNIALMNAGNLIMLGEAFDREDVAEAGYERLGLVVADTWQSGVHEYDSPTYYSVNLIDLLLIEEYCERESGREQARAMLELLWRDIAHNFYPPSLRLAGARSRDYNYLFGRGGIEGHLVFNGWMDGRMPGNIFLAITSWRPDEALLETSREQFPRYVRQSWGPAAMAAKAHYLTEDVTLSCSGANYGPMDMPLTIDLPGEDRVRGYFIPDARRDPYGKKKIPAGPHEKTLHLRPFFAGVQSRADALALVVYRDSDLPPNPPTLESHFVLPRDVEAAWIGDRRVDLERETFVEPLQPGEAIVLRDGRAVIGLRVPWARGLDGERADAALISDGNDYGAMRLTVAHHSYWGIEGESSRPGASFWVRVAAGVADEAAVEAWRREFAEAGLSVDASEDAVRVEAAGVDEPLVLAAEAPFVRCTEAEPAHTSAVLEVDGDDIGRPLLADFEPVLAYQRRQEERQERLAEGAVYLEGETTYFEAESGLIEPQMEVGEDDAASGGQFVWVPGEPGARNSLPGSVTWRLDVPEAGEHYLWGRVNAPTQEDDSFFVRAYTEDAEVFPRTDWHTGTHESWEWTAFTLVRSEQPLPLSLPEGEVNLEISAREDGTKIDRLMLTPYMDSEPR